MVCSALASSGAWRTFRPLSCLCRCGLLKLPAAVELLADLCTSACICTTPCALPSRCLACN